MGRPPGTPPARGGLFFTRFTLFSFFLYPQPAPSKELSGPQLLDGGSGNKKFFPENTEARDQRLSTEIRLHSRFRHYMLTH
jgi:hypothetical protein